MEDGVGGYEATLPGLSRVAPEFRALIQDRRLSEA